VTRIGLWSDALNCGGDPMRLECEVLGDLRYSVSGLFNCHGHKPSELSS
jgi:hypothetical protein